MVSSCMIRLQSPNALKFSIIMLVAHQFPSWIYTGLNLNRYATNLETKRVDLFEGSSEKVGEDNVLLASGKYII